MKLCRASGTSNIVGNQYSVLSTELGNVLELELVQFKGKLRLLENFNHRSCLRYLRRRESRLQLSPIHPPKRASGTLRQLTPTLLQ